VFLPAGEHWLKVPRSLFAAQCSVFTCLWISLLSFSEAFRNTSRYFAWSENCICTPFRKTFDGEGFYTFWGKTICWLNIYVAIKGDFMFSSIVTTNIQKNLQSANTGLNTHISSANIRWFTTIFSTVHPIPWLNSASLAAHQGKQQTNKGSQSELSLAFIDFLWFTKKVYWPWLA